MKHEITMTPEEFEKERSFAYRRGHNDGFWEGIQRIWDVSHGEKEPEFVNMEVHRKKLWDSVVKKVKP